MNMDEKLDRIEKKLDTLLSLLRANGANAAAAARPRAEGAPPATNRGGEVATDSDLDSPRGDPEVRFIPKRWSGADMKGKRFSECEPEFLDMLADAFDWFANRDDESGAVDKNGNPKSRWGRLDAARARGWANRIRNGGGKKAASSNGHGVDFGGGGGNVGADDDIPF